MAPIAPIVQIHAALDGGIFHERMNFMNVDPKQQRVAPTPCSNALIKEKKQGPTSLALGNWACVSVM